MNPFSASPSITEEKLALKIKELETKWLLENPEKRIEDYNIVWNADFISYSVFVKIVNKKDSSIVAKISIPIECLTL